MFIWKCNNAEYTEYKSLCLWKVPTMYTNLTCLCLWACVLFSRVLTRTEECHCPVHLWNLFHQNSYQSLPATHIPPMKYFYNNLKILFQSVKINSTHACAFVCVCICWIMCVVSVITTLKKFKKMRHQKLQQETWNDLPWPSTNQRSIHCLFQTATVL